MTERFFKPGPFKVLPQSGEAQSAELHDVYNEYINDIIKEELNKCRDVLCLWIGKPNSAKILFFFQFDQWI